MMYTQSNTYQKFCFSHHSFIFFVFFLQIHIMRCVSILCGCVAIWLHFKDHLPDTRHRVECIHIVILAVKLVRRVAVESWRLSRSRSKCSMLRLFKWGFEDFERTTKTPWHQDRYHGYHELPGPSLLKPACSEMLTSWKLGPGVSSQLRLLVKYLDETGWLRLI